MVKREIVERMKERENKRKRGAAEWNKGGVSRAVIWTRPSVSPPDEKYSGANFRSVFFFAHAVAVSKSSNAL